ncbi:hypothetical protein [Streptomyces sp. NPDC058623]|uniref:hypothetical protein n=1 Tax=Streptomyces sp. NPDC058623 TaxID=3346563 RepID=UPI003665DEA2
MSTAGLEAWAQAAHLLGQHDPVAAGVLLDELEEQAEGLAEGRGEGSAVAVQIWSTLAGVAPDREARIHDRVLDHVRTVWGEAPRLEHVALLTAVASLLARSRPVEAAVIVDMARGYVESVLVGGAPSMSAPDAFHMEFGIRHTLTGLARALTDTGVPEDEVRGILDPLLHALPGGPGDLSDPDDGQADEARSGAVPPARAALRSAEPSREEGAETRLDEASVLLPMPAWSVSVAPVWLPDLVGALTRIDASHGIESLVGLCPTPADRARTHAAASLAQADLGLPEEARKHAFWAAEAADEDATVGSPSTVRGPGGAWAYAAQALACAGEGEAALDLLQQHSKPKDPGMKAAWRQADRLARIAVASALAEQDPQTAGQLLLPMLDELHASRKAPRGAATLLGRFAALLPAETGLRHLDAGRFDQVKQAGLGIADRGDPTSWHPESVLVHALLRIGAGEDPGPQVNWLARELGNRGPEHFPTAALAVIHAARGDTEVAARVTELPMEEGTRAVALAALAGHLARVPVRPVPAADPARTDPFTRTIQDLALRVTSYVAADEGAAARFLHLSLKSDGWYHALPVLARLEPEVVVRVRDIVAVRVDAEGGPQAG